MFGLTSAHFLGSTRRAVLRSASLGVNDFSNRGITTESELRCVKESWYWSLSNDRRLNEYLDWYFVHIVLDKKWTHWIRLLPIILLQNFLWTSKMQRHESGRKGYFPEIFWSSSSLILGKFRGFNLNCAVAFPSDGCLSTKVSQGTSPWAAWDWIWDSDLGGEGWTAVSLGNGQWREESEDAPIPAIELRKISNLHYNSTNLQVIIMFC